MKFEFPWAKAARVKTADLEVEKKELSMSDQLIKFCQLEAALKIAADQNLVCNLLNGAIDKKLSKMKITSIARNNTSSSVFSGVNKLDSNGHMIPGRFIVAHQFDIDMSKSGQELHYHRGAYGEDRYWDISQWGEFVNFATHSVRNYRVYPE